jgi:hypothetical protein
MSCGAAGPVTGNHPPKKDPRATRDFPNFIVMRGPEILGRVGISADVHGS